MSIAQHRVRNIEQAIKKVSPDLDDTFNLLAIWFGLFTTTKAW